MNEDCGTGCNKEEHMVKCLRCGAKYHVGIVHHCPTGCWSGIC